ncbi:serine hydrolase [Verrucomicrobia bacterium LW23]|nr:serine hydrolase [Verrucomicrobia bacterium LW23]
MQIISGSVQERMQRLLDGYTQNGREWGLQMAVYKDGELLVNAASGVTQGTDGEAVTENTLFPVFSTTKGVVATLVHLLVERGKISYDTPVAEVWPEFATGGKEHVTLRHVMNHTCGLANIPLACTGYDQLCNYDWMCALLAAQTPNTPPGTERVYHALTYGWLMAEVARRVDGRPIAQMMREEITRPLGIRDMFVGLPEGDPHTVATLHEEAPEPVPAPGTPLPVPHWMRPLGTAMNRPDVHRACVPGANGLMSAAAVARHYAALVPGGVDGVEILPASRIAAASALEPDQTPGDDIIALGYRVHQNQGGRPLATFGHAGYGGSFGWACPQRRLAVGFTKNLFTKVWHVADIVTALLDAVDARG